MASRPQRGPGRGLDAILGGSIDVDMLRKPVGYVNKEVVGTKEPQDTADILRIPEGMIEPNPFQPRMSFDKEALEELAESIRTFGLIQPITVRKKAEGKYQIISGERRFRACRLAGMDMIPAYIRDANDQGMLEMAIVENIQRENLDPIEVAMSYQRLIEECSLTQEQMAERVGKKRASVTNYLRLLKLPAKVQHDLKVGLLSVGHAKVLLGVEDQALQEELCDMVIKTDMSVRQLEDRIRKIAKGEEPEKPKQEQSLPDEYVKVLEHMGRYFGNNISLRRSASGKGTMTVRFDSDEEMQKFLSALEEKNL
ncbi:MAG: ParB/RepB/Spo0J family partition protein [Bacteroidales bacterium]|jgi:ParB family chromosome partitioning protein|nr:ParB/RepB/Spo0J family partition protein [Bacteroidales bacterium]MEE3407201.1 ParB/RepB/Spo0J family partition protein [Candidatus Cryptobacteroides sp.]SKC53470.1 chromosome partitioning protein, ParB family [Bacteroidales bacterium WCE2008]MBO7622758.1 ParB/RepB/Spo0J family partition protein [Bacteroidales bacterium]MBP5741687.1 ParB/RepB/Spo0J family partition protein [Bacteroidales bacterium]